VGYNSRLGPAAAPIITLAAIIHSSGGDSNLPLLLF
jgi:hypothetical protein